MWKLHACTLGGTYMAKVPIMDTDSLRSWHKKEEGERKVQKV